MIHTLDLRFQGIEHAIAAFAVESSDGLVLIETGPYSTFPYLEKGLQGIGDPASISHVLLSHIHLDHAGAAWAMAEKGATIFMHPFGVKHMVDPSKLMESATRIYGDMMDTLWGQMQNIPENKIHSTSHLEEVSVGDKKFVALHTPGHAKHHIAWELEDTIFCGDVAGVKIGTGPVVAPCPPPDIDIEAWKDSIQLLRERNPSKLLLTHFGAIEKNQINGHLDELETILDDWANWIKSRWEAGQDMAKMTEDFSKYTAQQLVDKGVSAAGLKQYEAANPAWMSVAGLVRYWKNKTTN